MVASDAGAYAEIVAPGKTGAVVPAGDGAALREAIRPYLDNPEQAAAHGAAGLEDVIQRFRLSREASQIRDVYDKVWAESG